MRSYARNVSIAASDETLRDDCTSNDETFDKDVFAKYINCQVFILACGLLIQSLMVSFEEQML